MSDRPNGRGASGGAATLSHWSTSRTALIALLVFTGCYLGALAGTAMAFPGIGTAILFPPYAVLTAALVMAPVRRWWLLILASALGNYLAHIDHEGVASFVLMTESANVLRALATAQGIRVLCVSSTPFNNLRSMAAFIAFAALIGPAVGAFVGVTAVVLHNPGANYWLVWAAWLLSNTVTGLTLLPLLLVMLTVRREAFTQVQPWRVFEATALAIGLLAAHLPALVDNGEAGTFWASLYAPLPFLLWAAVRFGPAGAIVSLTTVMALTIAGAIAGEGPFALQTPAQNMLQVQLFLIAINLSVLMLAAVVRERAEVAADLDESRRQYRSVVDDQTEFICRFLPDGTLTFVNGAYCRYFRRSARELLGKRFWEFIPEQRHEAGKAHLNSVTPDRPVVSIEHEVIDPNGEVRWHHWTDRALFDEHSRVVEFQSVGRDVTDNRRAEATLRDNEQRLALAIKAAQLGVWDWDLVTGAATWSDQMKRMYGRDGVNPDAPLDSFIEMIYPEDRDRVRRTIIESMERPIPYEAEYRVVLPDGTIRWIQARGETIYDANGKPIRRTGANRDITERRLSEEALRQSESKFRNLADHSPMLIWMTGIDKLATWFNRPWLDFVGRSMAEESGTGWAEGVHPDDWETCLRSYETAFDARQPFEMEYRLRRHDGEYRWVLDRGRPLFGADDTFLGYIGSCIDVTEQRRAVQAIRDSEDQLRMFVQHTPAAVAMFDRNMKYIVYSHRWVTDYKLGDQNLVGRSHYEVFPGISDDWKNIYQRCMTGAVERHEEDPFQRIDGTLDWIRWEVRPWRRADGEIGGIIMFTEVVSARKRADEARRNFERRIRKLADQVPVHIWAEDEDGRGLFVNARYVEYTGKTADELLNDWPEIVHPEDAEAHIEGYRAAVAQLAEFHGQLRLRRHDGEYHWFDVIGVPHFDGEDFVGYVGCCIDITERKLAEEKHRILETQRQNEAALRQSEARFHMLADTAPVLVWMSGLENEGTYFNKPWLDFTGRTLEQELGYGWAESIHPDDRQRCVEICDAAFARRESLSMQFRLRRHDGEYRWVLDNGIPHFCTDGVFCGYIGSCVDITERKLAEEALEQADRRKDEFLAMLGHELRNPLAPIGMAVEIMRMESPGNDSVVWACDIISRQMSQLTRLVDDLLDVSRITRGKVKLNWSMVDLKGVVDQAVETTRPLLVSRNHDLSMNVLDRSLPVRGDAVRLAQIVSNLLNNAAKYTNEGGRISLCVQQIGAQAVIRVTDNGVGIPPDMLQAVFNMFTQLENPTDRAQGGLGIGLALVKRLVEMHGGHVEARSQGSGMGSEFIVTLPLALENLLEDDAQRPANLGQSDGNGTSKGFKTKRILIVDDNQDAAETLSRLLRMQRHEVDVVHDGMAALTAAQRMNPDIILLDIGMPKMSGLEVAKQLRQCAAGTAPILVATTGFGQAVDKWRSLEAGFDHHLVKPVNLQSLQAIMRE